MISPQDVHPFSLKLKEGVESRPSACFLDLYVHMKQTDMGMRVSNRGLLLIGQREISKARRVKMMMMKKMKMMMMMYENTHMDTHRE